MARLWELRVSPRHKHKFYGEDIILGDALNVGGAAPMGIGVRAGVIGGSVPHFQDWGDNPPSFSDVFVTCLWCITLGLHLRTVCQCIMTAPPAARAMQGLSNRRALCVEIPRD